MKLVIVGLGPGDIDDLSRKAWRVIKNATTVYLRTSKHGCVACLPQNGQVYHTFDYLYEASESFETVYETIVQTLLTAAQEQDVVYAVPGDPLVGESTTTRILTRAAETGIDVEIVNGISFIEPMLKLIGVDALDGLQILDGIDIAAMHHPPINPDYPALIGQVYSRAVASNVKLTLMNQYPDEFEVTLIHAAGTDSAIVETLPLYEIDRSDHIGHMTSLYVPALGGMTSFEQFQEIIAHLRAPEGCPWDRKQTHESLRKYLLEETYEVLEAIDESNTDELYRELGDLLLQIVLHTQIAIDDGEFYMTDVLRHVNEKMIRRHPHVFASTSVTDADEVVTNWEAIKAQEKAVNGNVEKPESLLDSIPKALPALLWAYQAQDRAARAGFDWKAIDGVRDKINEELTEILEAQTDDERAKEFGDLLFVLVNWARWLKIDPENALRLTNHKFYRRFTHVETRVRQAGKPMTEFTLEELDAFWNEAKTSGL
ncbi:MAG: nucleoside triphosphate pyrophosphohydrolase [Phototrophicales bacterium]|nr:MAG: nucleoside triphosphate pyrophosphohydrolase [Phototrophicales bacterium]RMG70117.1 MAG: nucleoside triphosphate pyrophosphohydrolase [Chloroflexota bacterium]